MNLRCESPLQLALLFPTERKSCRNTYRKTRRTKQVYSYYSNSVATTRLILQGGDIEIYPGPDVDHSLSLCLLNARSVRNKTAMLVDYLCDSKADLYAITETWLTEKDASVRAELHVDGYNLMDHCRDDRRGGGIGLICRDSLRVKKVEAGVKDSFEFTEWTVRTLGHNLRLLVIYRPPYSMSTKFQPMSSSGNFQTTLSRFCCPRSRS